MNKKIKIIIDFNNIDCSKYSIISSLFSFGFPVEFFSKYEEETYFVISTKQNLEFYEVPLSLEDLEISPIKNLKNIVAYKYLVPNIDSKKYLFTLLKKLLKIEKISLPLSLEKELEKKFTTINDYYRCDSFLEYSLDKKEVWVYENKRAEVRAILEKFNPNSSKYMVSPHGLYYVNRFEDINL